jgi:hypothetical protein
LADADVVFGGRHEALVPTKIIWFRPRRHARSLREDGRPKRCTKGASITPKTKSFIIAFAPNVQKLASL